jgi:hypothetical protein
MSKNVNRVHFSESCVASHNVLPAVKSVGDLSVIPIFYKSFPRGNSDGANLNGLNLNCAKGGVHANNSVSQVQSECPNKHPAETKVLIGICSCRRFPTRRAAVRETWMKELPQGVTARFFVGNGNGETVEEDVIEISTFDDYFNLPCKVHLFFQHALKFYDFDYVFKCDDDTYIFCERFAELLRDGPEFLGSRDQWPGHADGGAGYLLSRYAAGIIAESPAPSRGAEDVWVTRTLKAANVRFDASPCLLQHYRHIPTRGDMVVTGHHCSPDVLRKIHRRRSKSIQESGSLHYQAEHKSWRGPFKLLPSGFFSGGAGKPNGWWEFANGGDTLIIDWFHWPMDVLEKTSFGYSNPCLRLELIRS